MTRDHTLFLWQSNRSWWDYNKDGRTVHLNDNAPDYARESFKNYVKKFGNKPKKYKIQATS